MVFDPGSGSREGIGQGAANGGVEQQFSGFGFHVDDSRNGDSALQKAMNVPSGSALPV
jgi:hypothetical protein